VNLADRRIIKTKKKTHNILLCYIVEKIAFSQKKFCEAVVETATRYACDVRTNLLKGQLHEIFDPRFFFINQPHLGT
jgi:hypothetical protein